MNELVNLAEKTIRLERNAIVKTNGSIDTNVYYVENGSLRIFILNDGEEQNIRFGYAGNFIVPLDSYLTGRPSGLIIQAIKKTTVRVITKQQVDEFLQNGASRGAWIDILESLVIQQMERETDLLTPSPKERYERVLKRSPRLFQEIPNRHIANYLRMSPETLSRLKKS